MEKNDKDMAKISIKLDTRRKDYTVKLQVSTNGTARMISLGIRLDSESQWDVMAKDGPVVGHKSARVYNGVINARLSAAREVLATLEMQYGRKGVPFDELVRAVAERIDPARIAASEKKKADDRLSGNGVLAHYHKVMATYSGRTWEIYETTLRRIREYAEDMCGESRPEDYEMISRGGVPSEPAQRYLESLDWQDIDNDWLNGWNESMSDTKGTATRSIYLRTFRHVCNDAYKRDLAQRDPFKLFSVPRAEGEVEPLTPDEFRALFCADLTGADDVARYRDMAWFGFCAIGMNMVDVHKLTWDNVKKGYMTYTRSKTGRRYCIKLEPEAMRVIKSQGTDAAAGRKVFVWAERYKHHTDYVKRLNQSGLQRVGPHVVVSGAGTVAEKREFSPVLPKCHYYQLRHTWATFAHSLGISKDVIALCLGHGKRTVTDVYIRYEQKEIDEANRKVIDYAVSLLK